MSFEHQEKSASYVKFAAAYFVPELVQDPVAQSFVIEQVVDETDTLPGVVWDDPLSTIMGAMPEK